MRVYAGYATTEEIEKSTSGGAASVLTRWMVETGGVVFAVKYDGEFKKALYGEIHNVEDIDFYKGSKYFQKENVIEHGGKTFNVYERVRDNLHEGRAVLFIGLGCDIFALRYYLKKQQCSPDMLTSVELICDGVTPKKIHNDYVGFLENKFRSKIIEFSVRDKRYGWETPCLHVKFENQTEFNALFHDTQYGRAFRTYKCKQCYSCKYKGVDKHVGDLIIGDSWGSRPGMKEYNARGVSLFLSNTPRGEQLIRRIRECGFFIRPIELDHVFNNQPRLLTPHPLHYEMHNMIETLLEENNMIEAFGIIDEKNIPKRFINRDFEKIVIWGTGNYYIKNINIVECYYQVAYCVDNDADKWGKRIAPNMVCESPQKLLGEPNAFVIIMIQDSDVIIQVIQQLLDMGHTDFDSFDNWKRYRIIGFAR